MENTGKILSTLSKKLNLDLPFTHQLSQVVSIVRTLLVTLHALLSQVYDLWAGVLL